MKNLVTILMALCCTATCFATKIFVPEGNGYKQIAYNGGSINDVSAGLGCKPCMTYSYFDSNQNNDINCVIFRSFSDKILFVITEDIVSDLTSQDVKYYLKDYNMKKTYTYTDYETDLKKGIEEKCLTYDFMSNSIGTKSSSTATLTDDKYKYKLFFKNGVLISYKNTELYTAPTKKFRDIRSGEFQALENNAKRYWSNDAQKVADEINQQVECWQNIPFESFAKYGELTESTTFGRTHNYRLMYTLEKLGPITLRELKDFTHNKVKRLPEIVKNKNVGDLIIYVYKNAMFTFTTDGEFFSAALRSSY